MNTKLIFLLEIVSIFLISSLVLLYGSTKAKQAPKKQAEVVQEYAKKYIIIPADARVFTSDTKGGSLATNVEWQKDGVPLRLFLLDGTGAFGDIKEKNIITIALRVENIAGDKIIEQKSSVMRSSIVDPRMLELLQQGSGNKKFNPVEPDGLKEVKVGARNEAVWFFDKQHLYQQTDLNKYANFYDAGREYRKQFSSSNEYFRQFLPVFILPDLYMRGFNYPTQTIGYIAFFLIQAAVLTLLLSIIFKVKNLVILNLFFLVCLLLVPPAHLLLFSFARLLHIVFFKS